MIGSNDNFDWLCDSSTGGNVCYMFMSFIIVGKQPNFFSNILKRSLNKRFFTTSIVLSHRQVVSRKSAKFWHDVNSKNNANVTNPHYLVERFFQSYGDSLKAKLNLNFDLVKRIMSLHNPEFSLTQADFNLLRKIKPILLNYPFELSVPLIVGKPLRNGLGNAGAYLFTNKINGDRYVGSSINLASRLKNGYFGKLPIVGQRKVEVSIREHGLANFDLEVFLIPREAEGYTSDITNKNFLLNLVLCLEQILIMELNPELNEIKIAGSSPGTLTSKSLRNSYLYDEVNKQLIYVVKGRKVLAEILGCHQNAIKRYLVYKNKLYFNRFFVADDIINDGYTTNILSLSELEAYLSKIRGDRKNYLTKVRPSLEETNRKKYKQVELTNLVTKKVLIFYSLTKVASFIREYDIKFSKADKGTLSQNIRRGIPYKKFFKLRYIN